MCVSDTHIFSMYVPPVYLHCSCGGKYTSNVLSFYKWSPVTVALLPDSMLFCAVPLDSSSSI